MILLREKYQKEWESDWKNEAFLGIACALSYRDEEAFKYCKNAYEKFQDPPQSLIFAYVNTGTGCDRFIEQRELIDLINRAIKKGITYEAALQMAFLAFELKDHKGQEFWNQKALEAEANGFHTFVITPNILKSILRTPEGYQNEA